MFKLKKLLKKPKKELEKEAERVLANAKIEIERQTQEALSQVQTVATELAISLVIKVLKGTLDEKAKESISSTYLRSMKSNDVLCGR